MVGGCIAWLEVAPLAWLQVYLPAVKPLLVGVVEGSTPAAPLPANLSQVSSFAWTACARRRLEAKCWNACEGTGVGALCADGTSKSVQPASIQVWAGLVEPAGGVPDLQNV